jgi:hypothetical protein
LYDDRSAVGLIDIRAVIVGTRSIAIAVTTASEADQLFTGHDHTPSPDTMSRSVTTLGKQACCVYADVGLFLLRNTPIRQTGRAAVGVGFVTLGLQTFLTAGPKESRAWTIRRGATAPEAAGAIHTDFQRGFIKAEIVSYADLVEAGSMSAAKSAGKARIEGKDYVMQDGDVVEFRFNV